MNYPTTLLQRLMILPLSENALAEIKEYLEGKRKHFSRPKLDTSTFEGQVLQATFDVPFGETTTYKKLAEKAGSPRAARAVGNIMRKNRLPLIIPCHRVLHSNGGLGGYAWGLDIKQWLLNYEKES